MTHTLRLAGLSLNRSDLEWVLEAKVLTQGNMMSQEKVWSKAHSLCTQLAKQREVAQ
jgi:hypothetical protein